MCGSNRVGRYDDPQRAYTCLRDLVPECRVAIDAVSCVVDCLVGDVQCMKLVVLGSSG